MKNEIEIKKVSDSEIDVIDPKTKGVWKIIAPHTLSVEGALMAIEQTVREKKIQPAEGSTLTIHFQIKVQEDGEKCHPIFDDILEELAQAQKQYRSRKQADD